MNNIDEDETRPRGRKTKGKREKDIRGLPVNPVEHKMSGEELIAEFGKDGWLSLIHISEPTRPY